MPGSNIDSPLFQTLIPLRFNYLGLAETVQPPGKRYGFHGLSYEFIARALPEHSHRANGRVIVAHLGNGASMAAMVNRKCVATTLGFSTIDGLMMGTRCGNIVILVDASLSHPQGFSPFGLVSQETVVVLSGSSASITEAYALIKKVSHFCYRSWPRSCPARSDSSPDQAPLRHPCRSGPSVPPAHPAATRPQRPERWRAAACEIRSTCSCSTLLR